MLIFDQSVFEKKRIVIINRNLWKVVNSAKEDGREKVNVSIFLFFRHLKKGKFSILINHYLILTTTFSVSFKQN